MFSPSPSFCMSIRNCFCLLMRVFVAGVGFLDFSCGCGSFCSCAWVTLPSIFFIFKCGVIVVTHYVSIRQCTSIILQAGSFNHHSVVSDPVASLEVPFPSIHRDVRRCTYLINRVRYVCTHPMASLAASSLIRTNLLLSGLRCPVNVSGLYDTAPNCVILLPCYFCGGISRAHHFVPCWITV